MICVTKHTKSHYSLQVPKSTVFADKSQNSGRPRLGGNFFLSFAVSHHGYGMDVSLLTTCLFAHKDVEMHSLYPIYPAHLSGQQEPGGQGWGARAGVWGLLESTNTWSYVCSPETLAARFQSSLPLTSRSRVYLP